LKTIISSLKAQFKKAAHQAFPELNAGDIDGLVDVTTSTQEQFGHYQCNAAMKLAKSIRQNPRAVAETLVKEIKNPSMISKMEVAGPGFINITLNPDFLASGVQTILMDPHLGIDPPAFPQRVIIDFSSPNIAKEMHVGHLRSTIIGDCLARLFEFLEYDVLRLNHVGDWGTQFGMLISYMKEEAPEALKGEIETDSTQLVGWYKASKKRFDEDADFKKRAQNEVVALQRGDAEALKAWKMICRISEKSYQEIYDLLDVTLIERGESFYNPLLPSLIKDLEDKGLIQLSGGAKCIFLDGFQNREGEPLPLMVQKSDGGFNYDATDMAAIRQRIEEEKGDRLIYVTDAGQALHFQMVFKAAEKAGYLDPTKVRVDHVPFGLVLGADGKKFKTRSGDTEKLIDLLTTAVQQAKEILIQREVALGESERDQLAIALGIGAVKYADLSCHRTGDYVFSYERMLRFEGNTAAFLMYSYVRVAGIKRKVGVDIAGLLADGTKVIVEHPSEVSLAVHLMRFGEALESVANDLLPNRLTDYLFELAQKFNAFFRDCRVEGSPEQNARLLLCEATAKTLRQGFEILGLRTVERM
jgi:arginyl-tRNA synthetase